MFDEEKFTAEYYDKLSESESVSEKAEHDAILYGDSFVPVFRAPRWVEQYLEAQRWIDGIRDPEIDILTGCTQNFKPSQAYDRLRRITDEWVSNKQYTEDSILDAINEDYFKSKNNYLMKPYEVDPKRLLISNVCSHDWDKPFPVINQKDMTGFDPNIIYIKPRGYGMKFWIAAKLLGSQPQSFSIDEFPMYKEPVTTVQLRSVIHWDHSHTDYLKDIGVKDGRLYHVWEDGQLFNYRTIDISPIDRAILDTLKTFGHEITEKCCITGPNFNEDKKRLERFIKKGKRKK